MHDSVIAGESVELKEKISFVMGIGAALHQYGTPAHRLEQALTTISVSLGLTAQFFSMPTSILASFETEDGESIGRLKRVQPGEIDLERLSDLDELGDEVTAGRIRPAEGLRRVRAIMAKPQRYGALLTVIGFGAASAAISVFFRSAWWDQLTSFLIGLMIGVLAIVATRSERFGRLFEAVAAFLASISVYALAHVYPSISPPVVILAGLIVLIPGLTFTIAVVELATRNLVSGTARMMGAATTFLKLGFGVVVGQGVARAILPASSAPEIAAFNVPPWSEWVALFAAGLAFTVLFKARPRDMIWVILAGLVAHTSSQLGTRMLGPMLGVFIGGFCVAAASNLFSRYRNRPASVALLPGIILLVPGSIGYRSLALISENDVISGVNSAFQMLMMAVALVAGLFFANIAVVPRRSL